MNEFLFSCSQMKIIVTTDGNILSEFHIPEAITVYYPNYPYQDYPYLDQMAKIFTRQWQHKDVLSMMKEWGRTHTRYAPFTIESTVSSRVMFKKSE